MTGPAASAVVPLRRADALVEQLSRQPWGQVDPSTYETARLVADAPWLPGHPARVAHLLRGQRADGAWGPPEGYALVPTVSAVDALLAELARPGEPAAGLLDAVAGGLRALRGPLARLVLPDTPGADLIVPALVGSIGERLDRLDGGLRHRLPVGRPALPPGVTRERLDRIRAVVAAGADLPAKLAHFVEVLELPAGRLPGAHGTDPLAVGASPAATAAWLAAAGPSDGAAARDFLTGLVRHGGGPVPCPTPITVFERAWVLSALLRAGLPVVPPAVLVESLAVATGRSGIATGAGLPTDADTTAVALDALGRLGRPADPAVLWEYETDEGFCTWPGEDGFSVTTNAHVLDAFARHLRRHPGAGARHRAVPARLAGVLRERQGADGGWRDRWHASPYYATACCVSALVDSGAGPAATDAVAAAVRFVLRTQRPDGSWGRWAGTVEETAYALHVLLAAPWAAAGVTAAIARGYGRLIDPSDGPHPPLWYGKELYRPVAVVGAAVLAATQLASEHLLGVGRELPIREPARVRGAGAPDIQRLEGTCGHC
ncbi:prenyltransferase/squalene oxidase repeat-containing protein [Micromonospora mangrovi]|uniref:Prenyltransferase/squalene oxidase repeat-containing protein n=2 Tax=Micromonospora TaxID=1873 RepID=A0AAU8HIJ5_9ACTN